MNSFSNGVTTHEYVSMQSLRKVELMNLQLVEFISFSPLGLCLFDFSISVVCLPRSSFFFLLYFDLSILYVWFACFVLIYVSFLRSFYQFCLRVFVLFSLSLSNIIWSACLLCSLFVYLCLSVLLVLLSLCLFLSICSYSALSLSVFVYLFCLFCSRFVDLSLFCLFFSLLVDLCLSALLSLCLSLSKCSACSALSLSIFVYFFYSRFVDVP